jgi:hypothetical protein
MIEKGYLGLIDEPKPMGDGSGFLVGRAPQFKPKIILADDELEQISKKIPEWKNARPEESEKLQQNVFKILKKAIGNHYFKESKFNDDDLKDHQKVAEIAKRFEIDIKVKADDLIQEIGDKKIKEFYDLIMQQEKETSRLVTKWENIDDKTNRDIKIACIEKLITLTKKPINRNSYYTDLAKVLTQITVETEYRVLFTAKLKEL